MDTDIRARIPRGFIPHPNLSDEVNHNIVQSEIEGGVHMDSLREGEILEVETQNRWYRIENLGRGKALISGHPLFCPKPIPVSIEGCTWGGTMLKVRYIGRGMHLEFRHPHYHTIITSRIVEIRATNPLPNALA
ncbi:MAG: hypothetical protein HYS61_02210 [Acidobacteria bacterium]|nr:hypothetical protein [Acidobacteriota bacterium]